MPFIAGTSISENKVLVQSVAEIYGIGEHRSKLLCKKAGFGRDSRGKHVSLSKSIILNKLAESMSVSLSSDLRRFQNEKIQHLCAISTYRGLRHRKGLPVRGQRTHTNARKRSLFKQNAAQKNKGI
uniref:ribosomal protein S13 n=1 Tax=Scytothamnus australis TaxID=66621 RepID=UPI002E7A069F|nr:ribosomal protein S13 [Scytothamnus australis]WBP70303.1 ribosomal protein S13 [Scytothamnus australis]